MRTLRSRFILSHILPLVIIVPLVGLALVYFLETQILLTNLSRELERQANLTAEIANDQPDIWTNPNLARLFVRRFSVYHQSQVMLLDPKGNLLASSLPNRDDQPDHPLDLPNLPGVLAGQKNSVEIHYSQNLQAEIAEVLVPITNKNEEVIGVVRLTHQLASVWEQFLQLRYLIAGLLAVELVVGIFIGLFLALSLERSLRQVTEAIYGVAEGREWRALPEQGPREVRLLLHAFNTLIERLRLMEEARKRLLANIVHEVGRPIGALQSATDALLNGADRDAPTRQELLTGMAAEMQRLHPLLDNLAQLHGQVLGTLELNCQPTPLADWLPCTLAPWREAARAKDLQWYTTLSPDLPTLTIDGDRLAQALGNLLSNAIKYTPVPGSITISTAQLQDGLVIKVNDTGPGISLEEQALIFDPFYRSQPGHRFPQGMGLGLTIARDLIIAHGGQLELDSQPGQGSTFTIWLPSPLSRL